MNCFALEMTSFNVAKGETNFKFDLDFFKLKGFSTKAHLALEACTKSKWKGNHNADEASSICK